MSYRDIDPKLAGIYVFKNNINNKCYVGQGVSLRKRIKHHFSNIKTKRYDLPLYRAIEKHGIHNFTIDIIESFIPDINMTTEELIKRLNDLEIKYIELYKAYTEGYNCTKGGDFGVLGLKMTDEHKKKISKISKRNADKYYKPLYLYNTIDKSTIFAISITAASNITKIDRSNLIRTARGIYKQTHGYLVAFSLDDLEKFKLEYYTGSARDRGRYCPRYRVRINMNNIIVVAESVKEAAKLLNCSTSLIYAVLSDNRDIKGVKLEKILKN